MIALDTTVIVGYVTGDDPVQSRLASEVFARLREEEPGFVCRKARLELVWVPGHTYGYARSGIAQVLEGLLSATQLQIEDADALARSHSNGARGWC